MKIPSIIATLLGIYFFVAGCLQVAHYVTAVPKEPFAAFLPGLLVASWPLAVAAVLFLLHELSAQMAVSAQRSMFPTPRAAAEEEDRIPEAPVQAKRPAATEPQAEQQKKQQHVSYFNVEPEPPAAQQPAPAPAASAPAAPHSFFATPPPFQQQQQTSPVNATVPLSSSSKYPNTAASAAAAAAAAPSAPQPPPVFSPAGATVPLEKLNTAGAGSAHRQQGFAPVGITVPLDKAAGDSAPPQAPQQAPKQQEPARQQSELSFFKI